MFEITPNRKFAVCVQDLTCANFLFVSFRRSPLALQLWKLKTLNDIPFFRLRQCTMFFKSFLIHPMFLLRS